MLLSGVPRIRRFGMIRIWGIAAMGSGGSEVGIPSFTRNLAITSSPPSDMCVLCSCLQSASLSAGRVSLPGSVTTIPPQRYQFLQVVFVPGHSVFTCRAGLSCQSRCGSPLHKLCYFCHPHQSVLFISPFHAKLPVSCLLKVCRSQLGCLTGLKGSLVPGGCGFGTGGKGESGCWVGTVVGCTVCVCLCVCVCGRGWQWIGCYTVSAFHIQA